MSGHQDEDDLSPTETPGYKITAEAKSPEEYAKMDQNDESLARWKASLGIDPTASTAHASGPKLVVLSLELYSKTLPNGNNIVIDLTNPRSLDEVKKNPIVIKEGVEYNVLIRFRVNHSIVTGIRYLQGIKRAGITVDKLEQMLGSYGPSKDEPYVTNFPTEESPTGFMARSGSYNVRSRVIDDDKQVYADFDWTFKLAKEW